MDHAVMQIGRLRKKSSVIRVMQGRMYVLTTLGHLLVNASGFKSSSSIITLIPSGEEAFRETGVPFQGMKTVAYLTSGSVLESNVERGSCRLKLEIQERNVIDVEAPNLTEADAWSRAIIETIRILQMIRNLNNVPLQPLHGVNHVNDIGWYMMPHGRMGLYKKNENGVWFVCDTSEYDENLLQDYIKHREQKAINSELPKSKNSSMRIFEEGLLDSETSASSKDGSGPSSLENDLDLFFDNQDCIEREGAIRMLKSPVRLPPMSKKYPCAVDLLISGH